MLCKLFPSATLFSRPDLCNHIFFNDAVTLPSLCIPKGRRFLFVPYCCHNYFKLTKSCITFKLSKLINDNRISHY